LKNSPGENISIFLLLFVFLIAYGANAVKDILTTDPDMTISQGPHDEQTLRNMGYVII
jgi:uncharacterized membrane protein YcaP (DUF421 family)